MGDRKLSCDKIYLVSFLRIYKKYMVESIKKVYEHSKIRNTINFVHTHSMSFCLLYAYSDTGTII